MTTMMTTMVEKNELMVEVNAWVSTQQVVSCEKAKEEFVKLMDKTVTELNETVGEVVFSELISKELTANKEGSKTNVRSLNENVEKFFIFNKMYEYNMTLVYVDVEYSVATQRSCQSVLIFPNSFAHSDILYMYLAYENEVDLYRFFFDIQLERAYIQSNHSYLITLFDSFFE